MDTSVLLAKLDFLVFSALQTLNSTYGRIRPESALVSILGWLQSLYTLALVALLVASYVSQNLVRPSRR